LLKRLWSFFFSFSVVDVVNIIIFNSFHFISNNHQLRIGSALARATLPDDFENATASMGSTSRRPSLNANTKEATPPPPVRMAKARTMYNSVLYGIPSVYMKPSD
jgi:hypothetical protein